MNDAPRAPRLAWPERTGPIRDSADGFVHAAYAAMRRRKWRVAALVVSSILLWTVLLLEAASIPSGAALQPVQRVRHAGAEFKLIAGAGTTDGRTLRITSAGSNRMAVQALALATPVDARDFPVLRYRWQEFPQTLELSFMFRRADAPADVQVVTLPPAGRYPAYFDLSDVPAWRGRIIEVGFSEYPAAQLVPPDVAFRPFALSEMELWSPSWRGSLGALGTDWFAYRPWALMSVSALGPDAPWPHKTSPVVVFGFGLFGSVVLAAVLLQRGRRWFGAALCVALGAGWLALDLRWLAELYGRSGLTRELHAGRGGGEHALTVPDGELLDAAQRVRDLLARVSPHARVLVATDAAYTTLRLNYHLLPANAAPVTALEHASPQALAAAPIWLVTLSADHWRYDEASRTLHGPTSAFLASILLNESNLRVYRLEGAAP